MAALVIGVLLAVGALGFVLYPIFFDPPRKAAFVPPPAHQSDREAAVIALREIEFDRATGKLSESDYADLKARYTRQAIDAMRREQRSSEARGVNGTVVDDVAAVSDGQPLQSLHQPSERPSEDEIEAVVRAYRARALACPSCGPRPEPDAVFCSNCGRYLRDRCAGCGAPVEALDARYCVSCGNRLAA